MNQTVKIKECNNSAKWDCKQCIVNHSQWWQIKQFPPSSIINSAGTTFASFNTKKWQLHQTMTKCSLTILFAFVTQMCSILIGRRQRTSVATAARQSGTRSPLRQSRELHKTNHWIKGNTIPQTADWRPQEPWQRRKFPYWTSSPSNKLHFGIPKDWLPGDQKNPRRQ